MRLTPYLEMDCVLVFSMSSSFSMNLVFFVSIVILECGLVMGSNFILLLYFN